MLSVFLNFARTQPCSVIKELSSLRLPSLSTKPRRYCGEQAPCLKKGGEWELQGHMNPVATFFAAFCCKIREFCETVKYCSMENCGQVTLLARIC